MLRQIFSVEHMIASLLGSRKYFLHLPADTGGCEDIDHDDEVTLMHTSVSVSDAVCVEPTTYPFNSTSMYSFV